MKLIEWLTGEHAQQLYADMNYEYPLRSGIAINPTIAGYGALKPDPRSFLAACQRWRQQARHDRASVYRTTSCCRPTA